MISMCVEHFRKTENCVYAKEQALKARLVTKMEEVVLTQSHVEEPVTAVIKGRPVGAKNKRSEPVGSTRRDPSGFE